jgi:hypothetical protein
MKRARNGAAAAAAAAGAGAGDGAASAVEKKSRGCVETTPGCDWDLDEEASYMRGFGGHFSTEVLKGAIPSRGNTPQRVCI